MIRRLQSLNSIPKQILQSQLKNAYHPSNQLRHSSSTASMSESQKPQEPNAPESSGFASSESKKIPLALPEVVQTNNTIDMSSGSGSLKFDALGPVVVNVDGTVSRISNWDKMAEIEKENTLRIIGKRNKERLGRLRAEGKEEEGK